MLELFVLETCPYCRKVIDFMNENNIEFEKRDVLNQKNHDTLMELGKIEQVPFLHESESGLTLYDSADIIEYLKKNYLA